MKNINPGIAFFSGVALMVAVLLITSFENKNNDQPQEPEAVSQNNFYAPPLPTTLSFAGEAVPITRADVREKFDKEFLKIYFDPGNIIYLLKLANKNFPIIEERLMANGVPSDFKFLCIAESNMQSWAVSRAGAVGYWQFMASTASGYGLEHNSQVDERRNLVKATDAACKYFKSAYKKFGNWTAAAAAFNCGVGGYNQRAKAQHSLNYFDLHLPEETNKYMHRILSFKYILENAADLGYHVPDSLKYRSPSTTTIKGRSFGNLNTFANKHGISYKELQWLNPWIKSYSLPANRDYTIKVPANE